ncbi:MAG TPA: hypothetical protein VL593_16675 [Ramlibacter sp.]|jgi:hypothetical protein|nr:hypothetical protein [Ramlibacter sp.]
MAFDTNVFVNCPFDEAYYPLLRPLLFTIIYARLQPRIALEAADAGEARLEKIIGLIRESKFGIHDLSRCKASVAGEFYRMNMPFELGVDFGCRKFGHGHLRQKKMLILETEPHRYKAALSDLAGADIEAHGDEPYRVISVVRNWLRTAGVQNPPGPAKISGAFTDFMAENFDALTEQGFSPADIKALPIAELTAYMRNWVEGNA